MEPFQPFLIALLVLLVGCLRASPATEGSGTPGAPARAGGHRRRRAAHAVAPGGHRRSLDPAGARAAVRARTCSSWRRPSVPSRRRGGDRPDVASGATPRQRWSSSPASAWSSSWLPSVGLGAPDQTPSPTEALAAATEGPTPEATLAAIGRGRLLPLPTRVEVGPADRGADTDAAGHRDASTDAAGGACDPEADTATDRQAQAQGDAEADPEADADPGPHRAISAVRFQGGLPVAFDSTSRYAKRYAWDFDGDGIVERREPDPHLLRLGRLSRLADGPQRLGIGHGHEVHRP